MALSGVVCGNVVNDDGSPVRKGNVTLDWVLGAQDAVNMGRIAVYGDANLTLYVPPRRVMDDGSYVVPFFFGGENVQAIKAQAFARSFYTVDGWEGYRIARNSSSVRVGMDLGKVISAAAPDLSMDAGSAAGVFGEFLSVSSPALGGILRVLNVPSMLSTERTAFYCRLDFRFS